MNLIRKLVKKMFGRAFDGAEISRLFPGVANSFNINDDIKRDISSLRDQGRNLEQNTDTGKRFSNLLRTNVIGPRGITLISSVKDSKGTGLNTELNNELEANFSEFCEKENLEVSGRYSWVEVLYLFLSSLIRDGEAIIRHIRGWKYNRFGYAIQILEPDLLDETLNEQVNGRATIVMGIEINEWSRPVNYYFRVPDRTPNAVRKSNGRHYMVVPADEITHFFIPWRSSAMRGTSEFGAAIRRMRMLNGYDEAELVASRIEAAKGGFYKKTGGESVFLGSESSEVPRQDFVTTAEPGKYSIIPDGYEFQPFDPQHPKPGMAEFRKAQLRGIASALNIGYNDLASDYEGVNYTSLRASAIQDRDHFETLQGYLIRSICRDVYRNFVKCAFLKGVFKRVNADNLQECISHARWNARRWKWVDPYKEAQANIMLKEAGLVSEKEIIADRASELEEVYNDFSEAKKMREKLGLEFEPKNASDSSGDEENQAEPVKSKSRKIEGGRISHDF